MMLPAYTMPPNAEHVNMLARAGQANLTHALGRTRSSTTSRTLRDAREEGRSEPRRSAAAWSEHRRLDAEAPIAAVGGISPSVDRRHSVRFGAVFRATKPKYKVSEELAPTPPIAAAAGSPPA